jgi:hypothetical protein
VKKKKKEEEEEPRRRRRRRQKTKQPEKRGPKEGQKGEQTTIGRRYTKFWGFKFLVFTSPCLCFASSAVFLGEGRGRKRGKQLIRERPRNTESKTTETQKQENTGIYQVFID